MGAPCDGLNYHGVTCRVHYASGPLRGGGGGGGGGGLPISSSIFTYLECISLWGVVIIIM